MLIVYYYMNAIDNLNEISDLGSYSISSSLLSLSDYPVAVVSVTIVSIFLPRITLEVPCKNILMGFASQFCLEIPAVSYPLRYWPF